MHKPNFIIPDDARDSESRLAELTMLSSDVIDLFYTQTIQPETIRTPADVCSAFSEILGRHWQLCSISIFLRSSEGTLQESASHHNKGFDQEKISEISKLVAQAVETTNSEVQFWASGNSVADEYDKMRIAGKLEGAGVVGCVGVPIHAKGVLAGTLIVFSRDADRLKAAIEGIRFIAAPVVIAVGNVKRSNDMLEQHSRIEHLVDELKQHSQALEEANRELRRVALYRSMFLARMTHELRTPLTSILGFAEILLDHENLSETQMRFCGKIQSSGLQLQASLNHLVDLSRLEAGQSELFLHEFSVREAMKECYAAVSRPAAKRGVTVNFELPDLPSVVSDEGKLRQVFYNFLMHAISRSPEGAEITFSGGASGAERFFAEITDTGEAVTEVARLFESVDISLPTEKSANMNELGLVIARRLIDVLDGSVTLRYLEPRGLAVRLEFPMRPQG
jgi:signal transduction histidine kinase